MTQIPSTPASIQTPAGASPDAVNGVGGVGLPSDRMTGDTRSDRAEREKALTGILAGIETDTGEDEDESEAGDADGLVDDADDAEDADEGDDASDPDTGDTGDADELSIGLGSSKARQAAAIETAVQKAISEAMTPLLDQIKSLQATAKPTEPEGPTLRDQIVERLRKADYTKAEAEALGDTLSEVLGGSLGEVGNLKNALGELRQAQQASMAANAELQLRITLGQKFPEVVSSNADWKDIAGKVQRWEARFIEAHGKAPTERQYQKAFEQSAEMVYGPRAKNRARTKASTQLPAGGRSNQKMNRDQALGVAFRQAIANPSRGTKRTRR